MPVARLVLALAFLIPSLALAKDYSTPLVVIDATIRVDGSVLYEEHRTYRFDGSFSEADYRLSRVGFDEIRDIHVREGEQPYAFETTRDPGTYLIRDRAGTVDIVWYYRAQDEERTFTVSYVLEGAIVKGEEHAEFFWTYLTDRWERRTDSLVVNLRFEKGHPSDGVHAFLRGASGQASVAPTADGLRISGANFGRAQSLAVRTVFPATLVADMWVTHPEYSLALAEAQEEEARVARLEAESRRQRRAERWRVLALLTTIASVIAYGVVYRRYGQRPELDERLPVEVYHPPADLRPAIASAALFHNVVSSQHLVATLFDLCRRGYFRLVEQEPEKRRFQPDRIDYQIEPAQEVTVDEGLRPWERKVLALVHEEYSRGKKSVREVFDFKSSRRQKWFTEWQSSVRNDVKALGWYAPEGMKAIKLNLASQAPLLGLAIAAIIFTDGIGFLAFFTVVIMLGATAGLRPRTAEGEKRYRLLKAYRDTLRRGSLNRLGDHMNQHFAYAVAMMVNQKRLESIVSAAEPEDFSWLSTTHGTMISPMHLTKSIAAVTASVGSTVSTGTGASVGSAGGGAGGGAR